VIVGIIFVTIGLKEIKFRTRYYYNLIPTNIFIYKTYLATVSLIIF